ncbi:MAG TPA: WbqC family protein [Terriglobales bacterium]|nr:WbqC family protein [Terriglobales bacterium]
MKIAISQPTYLPWVGYFDLIDQVDLFVLLDNVQFEKRSWQQRNRIKTADGLQWLTIPVLSRGKREQRIVDVELAEPGFWRNHLRTIDLNYHRAPFFETYFNSLSECVEREADFGSLSRLTIGIIEWLKDALGIMTATIRASNLGAEGKRSELLANICAGLGATEYLSPFGSADYLLEDLPVMASKGIEVAFHHYEHPVYRQLNPPFQAYACALDVLFNEGGNALEIIRRGRRAAFSPKEAALQAGATVAS